MADTKLDAAIESRAARFSARFVVPVLLGTLVSVVSYIGAKALDEQREQGAKISGMAVDIANIRGELSGFKSDAEGRARNIADKFEEINRRMDRQASYLGKLSDRIDQLK
jgi:hypothetical protein